MTTWIRLEESKARWFFVSMFTMQYNSSYTMKLKMLSQPGRVGA